VHGRTRCQFYQGRADWSALRKVREAISIPLVVNGDIGSLGDAATAVELSGADAVMLGRASYGRPWLAGDIVRQATSHTSPVSNAPADLGGYIVAHYEAMLSHYGIAIGVRHARKHLGWYLDLHAKHAPLERRRQIMVSTDPNAVIAQLCCVFSQPVSPSRMVA
jgi:tRNA-dihydrouridine synthase B